jgi:hypothetical protein
MTAIAGTHPVAMRRTVARHAAATPYHAGDKVAVELGRRLGIGTDPAHQVLVGGHIYRTAAIVSAHIAVKAFDRLFDWYKPAEDAFDALTPPALTSDLMLTTVKMDAADDVARGEYQARPSQGSARALSRAYGRTMAKLRLEQLALGDRWGFTP